MNDEKYKYLIALVGAQRERIIKTLGKPIRVLNSVMFYKGKGGTLVIVLHSPDGREAVVNKLVLFSTTGEILYVYNLTLLDDETVSNAQTVVTFEKVKDILGEAATDIGSGRTILAYFTAKAQLLTLQRAGEENAKLTFLPLTGEEAKI